MNRSTGRPAQSRSRYVLTTRVSNELEGLERRTLLCAGGEHNPAIHAAMEAAQTPVVHKLHLTGAAQGAARFFQPLDALPQPQAGQTSYLSLTGYSPFTIDTAAIRRALGDAPREFTAAAAARDGGLVLSLPTPDGGVQRFRVLETQVLAPELAARFPKIKTYVARGIDDPTATARIDTNPYSGFHAMVRSEAGTWAIDPYFHQDTTAFVAYRKLDMVPDAGFRCETDETAEEHADHAGELAGGPENIPAGDVLRTFRLTATTTTAFNSFHGNSVGSVLSAVTTAVNRITGVYEVDLSTRLQLVANTDLLFSNLNGNPNLSTSTSVSTLANANQAFTDGRIGFANYDVGHVFASGSNNGVSAGGIGIVGSSAKARACSMTSPPSGDLFAVDYVAHEMGHQFNGRHNFSNCSGPGDSGAIANEPGSGATIMGYAGLCGSNNLQPNSDAMFNHINYNQMYPYIRNSIAGVGTTTPTGNSAPTVNAGGDYVIPTRTPYALAATGSDVNGDVLTYSWEQMDTGGSLPVNNTTGTSGPVVRTWLPAGSATRTIPRTINLLNNTTAQGEPLTTAARFMNFRVVARDGRGGVNFDDMFIQTINVGATGFAVTGPNTGGITWNAGSTQSVSWSVANTNLAPINTANVNIKLSTDGGNTFPITLLADTANDGVETITVPANMTTQARIKVEAVGNIYFDLSNANFTIAAPLTTPAQPVLAAGSDSGVSNSDRITNFDNSVPAKALEFSVGNTIPGATVSIYIDDIIIGVATATGTTTTVVTNGTAALANGVRNVTARQTPSGGSESPASVALAVTIDTLAPSLGAPAAFHYATAPHALSYPFSEDVGPTLAAADFAVQQTPGGAVPVSLSYDGGTHVATLNFTAATGGVLDDGNYSATLAAAGVTDVAGNPLAADDVLNFFFLMGDADHNGAVNLNDFNVLAANFGATPRDFTQGDFTYDGVVNLDDFNVLAGRFGQSLAPAGRPGSALPPGEVDDEVTDALSDLLA